MINFRNNQVFTVFIVCAAIFSGIFFRFYNIDKKIYWRDEIFTTMQVAGYVPSEVTEKVYNRGIVSASELDKYLELNPESSFIDMVSVLTHDPDQAPAYCFLSRLWINTVGFSMKNLRLFSAVISLLIFPCIYWLCRELFESKSAGVVAMVLVAVSPLHLIFAQEARQYSLWTVMILLSSAAFLRAKRINTKPGWVLYVFTIAAGLYTHWLFFLVVIAHGLYLLILEGFSWNKAVRRYLISLLSGILAFVPWILVFVLNLSRGFALLPWRALKYPIDIMVRKWAIGFVRVFFDILWGRDSTGIFVGSIVIIVLISSFYFLIRKASKKVFLFILTMMLVNFLFLALPDLMFGGVRSIIPRYLILFYLMTQLTVAYFFAEHVTSNFANAWQRKLYQFVFILIIFMGIFSCAVLSRSTVWWSMYHDIQDLPIARIVNDAPRPLLVSNDEITSVLCLNRLLEPKVHLQLVTGDTAPKIPDGYSNIFLFRPSQKMVSAFRSNPNFTLEHIGWAGSFWRLKRSEYL